MPADQREREFEDFVDTVLISARKLEIQNSTYPVGHRHGVTGCWGHVLLSADGLQYTGSEHNVKFSRADVAYVDMRSYGLRFHLRNGDNWTFILVDEDRVLKQKGNRSYGPSVLGGVVVTKWGFVFSSDGNTLVPGK